MPSIRNKRCHFCSSGASGSSGRETDVWGPLQETDCPAPPAPTALPLAWVLFHIELFADQGGSGAFSSGQGPATSTFFEAEDRLGNVVPICVGFDRIEGSGLITELRLPGCPPLRFMYGITQMSDPNALNIGIAPEDWDCVPSTEPSDAVCQGTGTTTHTAAPTTTTKPGTDTISAKHEHCFKNKLNIHVTIVFRITNRITHSICYCRREHRDYCVPYYHCGDYSFHHHSDHHSWRSVRKFLSVASANMENKM